MKICKTCVLPSTFPGVKFNADGICNYCQNFKGIEAIERQREHYRQKFEALISNHMAAKNANTSTQNPKPSTLGTYDVLVAYSGGKDSTFTLDLLKNHYDLRILALTFDHGFVSPYTLENIKRVVET